MNRVQRELAAMRAARRDRRDEAAQTLDRAVSMMLDQQEALDRAVRGTGGRGRVVVRVEQGRVHAAGRRG
jgi:hypothetical protein